MLLVLLITCMSSVILPFSLTTAHQGHLWMAHHRFIMKQLWLLLILGMLRVWLIILLLFYNFKRYGQFIKSDRLTLLFAVVTNVSILLTISIQNQEKKVRRINEMITKRKILWILNKFSQLISQGNVWRKV